MLPCLTKGGIFSRPNGQPKEIAIFCSFYGGRSPWKNINLFQFSLSDTLHFPLMSRSFVFQQNKQPWLRVMRSTNLSFFQVGNKSYVKKGTWHIRCATVHPVVGIKWLNGKSRSLTHCSTLVLQSFSHFNTKSSWFLIKNSTTVPRCH